MSYLNDSIINKLLLELIGTFKNFIINYENNIIISTDTSVINCGDKYEYNGNCYDNCTNGYYIDDYNISKCKCELLKCLSCPEDTLENDLCAECNTNYYPMENDSSNIGNYINCYEEIKGYYLDKDEYLFKRCYYTCKTCNITGNNVTHNCLQCNSEYPIVINKNNNFNCYNNSNDDYLYIIRDRLYESNSNIISIQETSKLEISTIPAYKSNNEISTKEISSIELSTNKEYDKYTSYIETSKFNIIKTDSFNFFNQFETKIFNSNQGPIIY